MRLVFQLQLVLDRYHRLALLTMKELSHLMALWFDFNGERKNEIAMIRLVWME